METKICSKCKVEKETFHFNKDKSKKDKLTSNCKNCRIEYTINNVEKIKQTQKEYYYNNRDSAVKKSMEYEKNKKKIDPIYTLVKHIGSVIRKALRYNKSATFREKSRLKDILGCSLQFFRNHLEEQFQPWMNWDNRGLYNGQPNHGWDVDHIIPKSTAKTIEEVIKLNHYTNLRPRCSYLNRVEDKRKNKIEK
jgi:hypothetical protein